MNAVGRLVLLLVTFIISFDAVRVAAQSAQAPPPPARIDENAVAAPADKSASPDEAAIREAAATFEKAFDSGDAKAVAAHFTQDGEYVADDGQRLQGRAAIEEAYAKLFADNPGVKMNIQIDAIRLINANTAMEDGRASLTPAPKGATAVTRYSAVHVKEDGQWRMASVHDFNVPTPSHYGRIEDLDWLIGTWTAENKGIVFEATFEWIANKNFIEQSFVSREGKHSQSSGKQIIGWDPVNGAVVSWTFTSDGGHAVGHWVPHETGWAVETVGVLMDGTKTTAVNILARLDDNAMSWRSVNRNVGEFRVLDTEEVILRRKADNETEK